VQASSGGTNRCGSLHCGPAPIDRGNGRHSSLHRCYFKILRNKANLGCFRLENNRDAFCARVATLRQTLKPFLSRFVKQTLKPWFYPIGLLHLARLRILPTIFWFRRNCRHPKAGDGTTLFVTLWEYEVKRGSEELFEKAYGPDGDWVRLFRRDKRYRGTGLLRDAGRDRVDVTIDMWESREAYEEFQGTWADGVCAD